MKQFFVTGCGRSGTSMVAGLFRQAGLFMGDNLHKPRESNPLGFFEAPKINQLNEQILLPYLPECYRSGQIRYGCDAPRKTHTWLARLPVNQIPRANSIQREKIRSYTSKERFCYKDTRFSYTIHEWISELPNAKIICVYRRPSDVVESILKECRTQPYLFDYAISVNQAFEVWTSIYRHIIYNHFNPKNWLMVSYDSVISGSAKKSLESFTDTNLDFSFPTRQLNRSKGNWVINDECLSIYHELKRLEKKNEPTI